MLYFQLGAGSPQHAHCPRSCRHGPGHSQRSPWGSGSSSFCRRSFAGFASQEPAVPQESSESILSRGEASGPKQRQSLVLLQCVVSQAILIHSTPLFRARILQVRLLCKLPVLNQLHDLISSHLCLLGLQNTV